MSDSSDTPALRRPVPSADGSTTLFAPDFNETYHSTGGAVAESRHIYLEAGLLPLLEAWDPDSPESGHPLCLTEYGFGTGLNALLTAAVLRQRQREGKPAPEIRYLTFEKYPLRPEEYSLLEFPGAGDPELLAALHRAPWEQETEIFPGFRLLKRRCDFREISRRDFRDRKTDLVYFDAFSPGRQPELWTPDIFRTLAASCRSGAVLVTYSASGRVKQALREAGFEVHRLPGACGKHHMVRAVLPEAHPHPVRAWWLAARPKTLAGAAVPVAVAVAAAAHDGILQPVPALCCLLFAGLMQIDANLINDLYDFLKGADTRERKGPPRACSRGWISPRNMRRGILAVSFLAACTGLPLLHFGGPAMLAVGSASLLGAWCYTAGPRPLAYAGWGDAMVLVFFGWVPVLCTYFVMQRTLPPGLWLLGAGCGLAIEPLLLINNLRDLEEDRRNGKRTLVVRLGARAGRLLHLASGTAAALLPLLLWPACGPTILLVLFFLPLHLGVWRQTDRVSDPQTAGLLLEQTARNILVYGILMVSALILS